MDDKDAPIVESPVLTLIKYVVRHPGELMMWATILSTTFGAIIYVIHSVRIGYVADTDFPQLAGTFVLMTILGLTLVAYLGVLFGAPGMMWASSMGPVPRLKKEKSWQRGEKLDYLWLLIAFGVLSISIFWLLFCSEGNEINVSGWQIIAILAAAVGIVSLVEWVLRRRSGKFRPDAVFLKIMSLLMLATASVFAVLVVVAPSVKISTEDTISEGGFAIFIVAAINFSLVPYIRSLRKTPMRLVPMYLGICVLFTVLFIGPISDGIVRSLGLGFTRGVTVALEPRLAKIAEIAGFTCRANDAKHQSGSGDSADCVIETYLVSRIGPNYLLMRNEDAERAGLIGPQNGRPERLSVAKYFIVPKSEAILLPHAAHSQRE